MDIQINQVLLDIAIHIINIVVLFVILRAVLYKPVRKYMSQRSERIKDELGAAAKAEKAAEEEREKYAQELERVSESANAKAERIIADADERADKMVADARAQSEKIVAEARKRAEAESLHTREAARDEITELSVQIAEKILAREINEQDNLAIAESFFNEENKQ